MEVIIRKIDEHGLSESAEVLRRSFRTESEAYGLTEQSCPTDAAFISTDRLLWELGNGVYMYGAFLPSGEGEMQVGFVALDVREKWVNLEKLGVLPEFRRMGIGTALLDRAKHEAAAYAGILRVGVIDENAEIKKWYSKRGFEYAESRAFEHLPFTVYYMETAI